MVVNHLSQMAEEKSCLDSPTTTVIITSTSENEGGETDHSNPISSSDDSMLSGNIASSSSNNEENASNDVTQSHEPVLKPKVVFNDIVSSSSENSNGIPDSNNSKPTTSVPNLVLKPSSLVVGFSNKFTPKNTADTGTLSKPDSSSSSLDLTGRNSPSVSFGSSTLQTNSFASVANPLKPPSFILQASKLKDNPFILKTQVEVETTDPVTSSILSEKPVPFEPENKAPIILNNPLNSQPSSSAVTSNSSLSVSNFVFGQNLHERVSTDGLHINEVHSTPEPTTSNGTAEMLFTSVLSSKDGLEKDATTNGKDSSSLYEDAARYQEARSNKRKYEEVQITTGEEGEENILQVNVKLFAFVNGSWLERGRGTLRLNDKNVSGSMSSRIVVRTLGSLRVVLNTNIWTGMSLSRASDKSIRITALDANGQLKIFLIQSSPKDVATLYRCLEYRLRKCKENDPDYHESPEKKIALSSSLVTSSPVSSLPTDKT